jgi:gliding motility-associated protein GldC
MVRKNCRNHASTSWKALPSRRNFDQTMSEIKQKSEIRIEVGLDAEKMPVSIAWSASDNPQAAQLEDAKAMLISFFSREHMDTAKIDLWTKDMQVNEMDRFMFQTLRGLADTYYKSTQNTNLARAMQQFVQYFGEETEVIPKQK